MVSGGEIILQLLDWPQKIAFIALTNKRNLKHGIFCPNNLMNSLYDLNRELTQDDYFISYFKDDRTSIYGLHLTGKKVK